MLYKHIIILFVSFIVKTSFSQNCFLEVPIDPLNTGLFKPWFVSSNPNSAINCTQTDSTKASFVEATIFHTDTNTFSIYNPLVLDKGTNPFIPITTAYIKSTDMVVIHFGTNSNSLELISSSLNFNTLGMGNCITKVNNSIFGQFSYCNAENFFKTVNAKINFINIPPLGVTVYREKCPSVRSFTVDQDQSDNVLTSYILTDNNIIAQDTPENQILLRNMNEFLNFITNGRIYVNKLIGCQPYTAPDFINPTIFKSSLALNEIQASVNNFEPNTASIPPDNPIVLIDNIQSLEKINAYRIGVNQPLLSVLNKTIQTTYCLKMDQYAIPFFFNYQQILSNASSPNIYLANNLLNFLIQRYINNWTVLNCSSVIPLKLNLTYTRFNRNTIAIENNINDIFHRILVPEYSKNFCGYNGVNIDCNKPCPFGSNTECGIEGMFCYVAWNVCPAPSILPTNLTTSLTTSGPIPQPNRTTTPTILPSLPTNLTTNRPTPTSKIKSTSFCGFSPYSINCTIPCPTGQDSECIKTNLFCYESNGICNIFIKTNTTLPQNQENVTNNSNSIYNQNIFLLLFLFFLIFY